MIILTIISTVIKTMAAIGIGFGVAAIVGRRIG